MLFVPLYAIHNTKTSLYLSVNTWNHVSFFSDFFHETFPNLGNKRLGTEPLRKGGLLFGRWPGDFACPVCDFIDGNSDVLVKLGGILVAFGIGLTKFDYDCDAAY